MPSIYHTDFYEAKTQHVVKPERSGTQKCDKQSITMR